MKIFLFSLLAALFTVAGGGLPLLKKNLGPRGLSLLVAFSAGVLLSAGINHMIAESYEIIGKWSLFSVSLGFIIVYLLEKGSMIHSCREVGCEEHYIGGFALLGIGFHNFLDGIAIAISMELSLALGALVVMAVLLHSFPTGISISSIMLAKGYSQSKSWSILGILGVIMVFGTLLGLQIPPQAENLVGMGIGISAGTFLYIASADLLPLAHQNNRDYAVPASFLFGFIGILLTAHFLHY
jgi:zinc and cadmium transporter